MTVSMRVMSAGDGYKYLLKSVAAGDTDRSLSTPLTRYYAEAGTPPGRWLGSGVASLGDGQIVVGNQVSEAQLQLLVGMGRDPLTGAPLGRSFPAYESVADRIAKRVAALDPALGIVERTVAEAEIEAQETASGTRRAVAGYDFTFSIPKSASVLWAVADADTQAIIAKAHHAAVSDVVAVMEREVAATRAGATPGDGAVAQLDVTGLIATAFDHFDSRASDPHLHTHVVVSNKVRTALDGKWRSLDSRPLHGATVALSELHEALFADRLTRALGVEWEQRARGRDRNPTWAITTVPEALVDEFSDRARHIEVEARRLVEEWTATHGRRPSRATIIKLRQQATLATRPQKQARSLADLTAEWRLRAGRVLETDATVWARAVAGDDAPLVLRADDVPLEAVARIGANVVAVVGEKRSTWRRWNLYAEAARQTMHWRFGSTEDREAIIGLVVEAAEQASVRLTPPELASSPAVFTRADGTSVFRPTHSAVFSSQVQLAAEDRLRDHAANFGAPTLDLHLLEAAARQPAGSGRALGEDQFAALAAIGASGRLLDVLVGPAGTGKTTAMHALRRAWEQEHGRGSVVGLAPSATASSVLAEDVGIGTDNTAMWLTKHDRGEAGFVAGQLVIIDEASLVGTLALDRIVHAAAHAGAKVLLVGDWAQLQSVEAGGAFGMLVAERDDAPELVDVHRFTHAWERAASRDLRHGRVVALEAYDVRGRIVGGDADAMADAAYAAWRRDREAGLESLLIADSGDAVVTLNRRARADVVLADAIDASAERALHDGTAASVGDTIVTRQNDRRLRVGRDWVRNGMRWTVTQLRRDGSLVVRRTDRRRGGGVVLPATYVAAHVELGYAVTAYRAQGTTTDTAHALVEPTTTRESLYVAMTRGRTSNTAYVALNRPDEDHGAAHPGDDDGVTARAVLAGVLTRVGAELSATEALAAEQDSWSSIAQLAAEYETIAAAAQHDRWAALVRGSGLSPADAEAAIESEAFGALTAELRRAEAKRYDVDGLLPRLVAARGFADAEDIAAVLHGRVERATARARSSGASRQQSRLIAGLVPVASGPMESDMRRALEERRELMEARATAMVDAAVAANEAWVRELGPGTATASAEWRRAARIVAAYRDRYRATTDGLALGAPACSAAQRLDEARAVAALREARRIAQRAASAHEPRSVAGESRAHAL
ncbi:MobF family relaxase [Demequina iriomotensis]|uniref:MobF family relaxase n=1 Tax=Demequina iriomotensis TaxID=1536641 RepID=UPI0007851F14|nr:MobF family relaxase [Demequina iriomotensis]